MLRPGFRRIDLSKELRRVLMDLRDSRMLDAFGSGEQEITKLVFPSETGGPMDGTKLYNRHLLPSLQAGGLRRVTFHALRHTYASLLIQGGESLAYVKEQMGHSSIQVTVDTYGHLIPSANIAWVDRLDSGVTPQLSATRTQPTDKEVHEESPEVIEMIGGPTRTRTWDQRIMSPLL